MRFSFFNSIYVYIAAFFLLAALVTGYYFSQTATTIEMTLGGEPFITWVADTPHLRQVGLAGKSRLSDRQAMLFIFDTDEQHVFWMKGMHIPIDILWLDADKKVVAIAANVSPETYHAHNPQTSQRFMPPVPARYVVELAAGNAARMGLVEGSVATW